MAGITSSAGAVDVGRIALVLLVHLGLRMASAIRADKRSIGRRIRMASRAYAACVAVGHAPEVVSKRRAKPIRRGVARRAGGWNDSDDGRVGGGMIWYRPA